MISDRRQKGFTLIEVIITLGIAAGIIVIVGLATTELAGLGEFIGKKLENREDVDQTFQTIVTEIRSMGPSEQGGYPIEAATSTAFIFFSDYDKDGVAERVHYFLTTTSTLMKGVVEPTGNPPAYILSSEVVIPIVHNVVSTSSVFIYFGDDYAGVEPPLPYPIQLADMRVVRIEMRVDVNPGASPEPTFFSNTINVRNLRSN